MTVARKAACKVGMSVGRRKEGEAQAGQKPQEMRHCDAVLSEDPFPSHTFLHTFLHVNGILHQGFPAMALSLDNHQARKVDDYNVAAKLSVSLIKVRGAKV